MNRRAQLTKLVFVSAYASLQVISHLSNIASTRAKQWAIIDTLRITSRCDSDGPNSCCKFKIPGVLFLG